MPLAKEQLSKDRFQFYKSLSKTDVEFLCSNKDLKVLQTAEPVKNKTWGLINDVLLLRRPDIEIRVYGHYSVACDLSFLSKLQNVRNISLDCLMNAHGIEHISALQKLNSLSIGIFSLDNFDFLAHVPSTLSKLFLGATKSKKPSLENLERFKTLKTLYIEGQQKGIEVIGLLDELEDLTLRSVSPKDVSFIRYLPSLWSLDIKLGSIKDFSSLEELNNLKYLELWQVKGLSDISVISTLKGLQYLFLQSLCKVTTIPDLSALEKLRRIYLENMKGLADVHNLFDAPSLEDFIHVCAQNMRPEQYFELLKMRSIKQVSIGFGSDKKNNAFETRMKEKGIEKYEYSPFVYV